MGTPYLGEVKIISWNFPPKGWVFCNGQLMSIAQNQALFSVLGTTYGGNGQTTFGLPDLRGRVAMHSGNGSHVTGEVGGEPVHTLSIGEMASHIHTIPIDGQTAATSNSNTAASNSLLGQTIGSPASGSAFPVSLYGSGNPGSSLAPATIGLTGGSQAHENRQPYLVVNFIIALQGVFPSRN